MYSRILNSSYLLFFIFLVMLTSSVPTFAQTVIEMKDSVVLNPGCRPNSIRDNETHYWVGTDCGLTSINKQDSSIAHFYPGGIDGSGVYVIQLFEDGYMLVFQGKNFYLLDENQEIAETYEDFVQDSYGDVYINSFVTGNGLALIQANDSEYLNLVYGYTRENGFELLFEITHRGFHLFQWIRDMRLPNKQSQLSGFWIVMDVGKIAIIKDDLQYQELLISESSLVAYEPFVVDSFVFIQGGNAAYKILEDGSLDIVTAIYPKDTRTEYLNYISPYKLDDGLNLLLTPFHDYQATFNNDTLKIDYYTHNDSSLFYTYWQGFVHTDMDGQAVRVPSGNVNKLIIRDLNSGTELNLKTSDFLSDMNGGNIRNGNVLADGRLRLDYFSSDYHQAITDLVSVNYVRTSYDDLELTSHIQLNSNTHTWKDESLMLYEKSDGTLEFSEFDLPLDLDSLSDITLTQSLKIAGYKKTTEELVHLDMFDLSKETWHMPVESNRRKFLTDNCLFQIETFGYPLKEIKVTCKDGFQSEYFLPMDIGQLDLRITIQGQLDQIMFKGSNDLLILSRDSMINRIPFPGNYNTNTKVTYGYPYFVISNINSTYKFNADELIELKIQGKYLGEDQLGNIFSIVGGKLVVYHPNQVQLPPMVPRPIPNHLFLKVIEDTNGNGLFDQEDETLDWARVIIEDNNSTYYRSLNAFQESVYTTFSDSVRYTIDLGSFQIISGNSQGTVSFENFPEFKDSILIQKIAEIPIETDYRQSFFSNPDSIDSGKRNSITCIHTNLSRKTYDFELTLDMTHSNSLICHKRRNFTKEGQHYVHRNTLLPFQTKAFSNPIIDPLRCYSELEGEEKYLDFHLEYKQLNNPNIMTQSSQLYYSEFRPVNFRTSISADTFAMFDFEYKYVAMPDRWLTITNTIDLVLLENSDEKWKVINTFSKEFFDLERIEIQPLFATFIHNWLDDSTLVSELVWPFDFDCEDRELCVNINFGPQSFAIIIKPNPHLTHLTLIENRPVIWAGDSLLIDTLKSDILFFNPTISTSEESVKSQFKIFPNPVHQTLTIDYSEPQQHFKVDECKIFNTLGQLVYFTTIEIPAQINVESWPQGLYNLMLFKSGEWISSQKFVVSD